MILIAGLVAAAFSQLRSPGRPSKTIKLLIHRNQTVRQIGETLAARQVIRSPALFVTLARVLGNSRDLRLGRYTLPLSISEYQALRVLRQGGEKNAFVTIPEGFTILQIARRLATEQVCDSGSFLAACHDTALLRRVQVNQSSAEGYLFPDSYYLPYETTPEEIIGIMSRRFFTVYSSLSAGRNLQSSIFNLQSSILSLHEIVTLASIVEAEAERDSERAIVASVFLNRLKRGMHLQSCATIEYLLPQRKAILTDADTKIESPYNTYLHPGLPPGPIGNPGKASLRAALYPAKSDYLFFVSKGDGRHHFSATFAEHTAAQRRYQRKS